MTTTEKLAYAVRELIAAMHRYEYDVDDPPTIRHREMMNKANEAIAAYEAEQAEAKLPITHGLRLSGCKDHPDESRDLSCLGIRREDGTRLSWREVWELMRSTELKREV